MQDRIEVLRRVAIFEDMSDEIVARLAPKLEQKHFAKGELLCRLGDPGDMLYIVDSGRVQVYLEISGKPLTLNEMGPGQTVGEMAVIDGKPRSANVVAVEDSYIWLLDHQSFMEALYQQPPMATTVLSDLAVNLRFANSVIEKAAKWSRSVAEAHYDEAMAALHESESADVERFEGFLRAFSAMVSEVQAREEAYRREVLELRIIIDEDKRDRELKEIESSVGFRSIAEEGRRMREARRKRFNR